MKKRLVQNVARGFSARGCTTPIRGHLENGEWGRFLPLFDCENVQAEK